MPASSPRPDPLDPADAHVVVVGVGGIGCPCAWALAEAGVGRLTLLDFDEVARSNLPRQVLYEESDCGSKKALVAAKRLAGHGGRVEPVVARLDHENEAALLDGADLVVDATDGARAKDWVNAAAVRRGVPLVHAAGLRSEGRLLDVPAGGRPCLACLFGRLEEDVGTCADLGVWGSVVGVVGFLAAARVLARLRHPSEPPRGYAMIDLEGGRAFTLAANPSPVCPVCGRDASREVETYPMGAACAAKGGPTSDPPTVPGVVDLTKVACPTSLFEARAAIEGGAAGPVLEILLAGQGATNVPDGLRALGHRVLSEEREADRARLRVQRRVEAGPGDLSLEPQQLVRFARQIVLPDVGTEGQRTLLDATVHVVGFGPVADTAATYARAAGVTVEVRDGPADVLATVWDSSGDRPFVVARSDPSGRLRVVRGDAADLGNGAAGFGYVRSPAHLRALGALLADAIVRRVVHGAVLPPPVAIEQDGQVVTVEDEP